MNEFYSRCPAALRLLCGILILCACGCTKTNRDSPEKHEPSQPPPSTQTVEDKRPVIVALGNSLTAGQGVDPDMNYPSMLQRKIDEEGYTYKILNFGVSGDTSGQGLNRLGSILKLKPAFAIVELGANDGLRGIPAEVTRQNLMIIVERLQAAGVKVILAGMQVPPNYGPQYTAAFGSIFRDIAKKYHVALIPFFLEHVGGIAALNQEDGIHPTAEGYKIVVENVWKILKPQL